MGQTQQWSRRARASGYLVPLVWAILGSAACTPSDAERCAKQFTYDPETGACQLNQVDSGAGGGGSVDTDQSDGGAGPAGLGEPCTDHGDCAA